MTEKMVYAQNTDNGVVALVPARYLQHPILGKNLVQVRSGKVRQRLTAIVRPDEVVVTPNDIAPTDGRNKNLDKKEDKA